MGERTVEVTLTIRVESDAMSTTMAVTPHSVLATRLPSIVIPKFTSAFGSF